jgi:hypothetical protein
VRFHFAQYQFYPLILKLFLLLTRHDSWFALAFVSLFQSALFSGAFFFMLHRRRIVRVATVSCYLLIVYPFNLVLLKYVALPHTLSLSFVFFAFGYFEVNAICACGFCCLFATVISVEGIICPLALSLTLLLKGRICDFLKLIIVSSLFVPCFIAGSLYMYRTPFAFVMAMERRVTTVPYSVCSVLARERPIAFIFGTVLSFALPSLIGTILLITISLPHFLYCLLSLLLLGFVNDLNFERYGGGLAVFAFVLGCDQYIWFVMRPLKHWPLLLFMEVLVVASAVHAFDYRIGPKEYCDYALAITPDLAPIT